MHIILHKRCSHYTQNMHIILHILCIIYAYNIRDSDFVLNQRLNNGLIFRLRWRRLFHKYSCCDTPSIDWSDFVWCAQPFPCQSFIVCFMANHVENTAALTCIWCIRLARTVNANKHSARFTGGRPQSTYSIPLPPFKVQERFTSPLHHSLGDTQRNGYRKWIRDFHVGTWNDLRGYRQPYKGDARIPICLDRHKSKKNQQQITDQMENGRSLVRHQAAQVCASSTTSACDKGQALSRTRSSKSNNVDKYHRQQYVHTSTTKVHTLHFNTSTFKSYLSKTFKLLFCYNQTSLFYESPRAESKCEHLLSQENKWKES